MTKAEIIESLLDQANDKDSLADDSDRDDIFTQDAKALREAAELLKDAPGVDQRQGQAARGGECVMKVTLIYKPEERELMLFKRCLWVTTGKTEEPEYLPSSGLLRGLLLARHSPIRVLNFAFLCEDVPSNIATHFARHVHAVPFISSLRNDRQKKMDGDTAPRNTPVSMILYVNAEELQVIANKRLCGRAAEKTRELCRMMCDAAIGAMPELAEVLVPMCEHCGGRCYELKSCGRNKREQTAKAGA